MKPMTLEEYREWEKTATRNFTDDPIGSPLNIRPRGPESKDHRVNDLALSAVPIPGPASPAERMAQWRAKKAAGAATSPTEATNTSPSTHTAPQPENAA